MKMIKALFAALIISGFAFSCSSDGDGNSTGGDLTARWNESKTIQKVSGETYEVPYNQNEPGCAKDFIEFTDAGIVNRGIYYRNIDNVCTEDLAMAVSYERDGNILTINGGPYDGEYEIKKLTNSQLTIQTERTVGSVTTTYITYFTKASM